MKFILWTNCFHICFGHTYDFLIISDNQTTANMDPCVKNNKLPVSENISWIINQDNLLTII